KPIAPGVTRRPYTITNLIVSPGHCTLDCTRQLDTGQMLRLNAGNPVPTKFAVPAQACAALGGTRFYLAALEMLNQARVEVCRRQQAGVRISQKLGLSESCLNQVGIGITNGIRGKIG